MVYTAIIWYVFALSLAIRNWLELDLKGQNYSAIPYLTLLAVVIIDIFVYLPAALNKQENKSALSILFSTPVSTRTLLSNIASYGSRITVPHILPYIVYYGIWALFQLMDEYQYVINPTSAYQTSGAFFGLSMIALFVLFYFRLLISAGIICSMTAGRAKRSVLMILWICFCSYLCIICGILASRIMSIFYPGIFGSWYFGKEMPDCMFFAGMSIAVILFAAITEYSAVRLLGLKRHGQIG
jgi:hypothetical protein